MSAEKLRRDATYPGEFVFGAPGRKRYRWNGEKRPPRKGEFYLSGSIITAYQARGDLSYPYHIAEEVCMIPCPTCNGRGEIAR